MLKVRGGSKRGHFMRMVCERDVQEVGLRTTIATGLSTALPGAATMSSPADWFAAPPVTSEMLDLTSDGYNVPEDFPQDIPSEAPTASPGPCH